jgi:hypothetical protein
MSHLSLLVCCLTADLCVAGEAGRRQPSTVTDKTHWAASAGPENPFASPGRGMLLD